MKKVKEYDPSQKELYASETRKSLELFNLSYSDLMDIVLTAILHIINRQLKQIDKKERQDHNARKGKLKTPKNTEPNNSVLLLHLILFFQTYNYDFKKTYK